MIRIGVISDTHNHWQVAYQALLKLGKLDLVCHGGDMYQDGVKIGEKLGVDTKVVGGNCDFGMNLPAEQVFEAGGKKILLTHGHKFRVKTTYQSLLYKACEVGADVVIFGHTHVPANFTQEDILFFNPGSIVIPRGNSKPSFGLLEITNENVAAKIFTFSS